MNGKKVKIPKIPKEVIGFLIVAMVVRSFQILKVWLIFIKKK
jgi:hypothetical protein